MMRYALESLYVELFGQSRCLVLAVIIDENLDVHNIRLFPGSLL
jgi:hypothetical protein